jgi:dihydroflavonol-4-reductase
MNLVTGATGHVGNVLVRRLVADGAPVRALVLPRDDCAALRALHVERVEGNVLEPESLDRAMVGVDTVYHLAGIISIVPGTEALMRRVNVEGVRNVAAAARRAGVSRMVHVSSIHAFSRLPDGAIVDETTPLALATAAGSYDRSKAEGTLVVREAIEEGLDAVIVHPTAIIGPYDYLGSELGKAILGFAQRHLQLLVHGAYDFIDVRDIVDGMVLARERGRQGQAYILSGTYATIPELSALVQRVAGIHTAHLVLPKCVAMVFAQLMQHVYSLTGSIPQFTPYSLRTLYDNARFSSGKARDELGFGTRPLADTIGDTLLWRRSLAARS